MKNIFTVILLLISISIFPQEKDSTKTYYLGEIVVTASDEAIIKTTSTNEIDKKSIDVNDKFSVNESLRSLPGIFLEQNGRNEALLKLRGFDQRQIAVFYDGVPFYISYDGNIDLSQINSSSVGKIVVSKSMSSVLYGANTLGGSVNIISDEPLSKLNTDLKMNFGNTYGASVKNTGRVKSLYWLVSGNYDKSDGFNLPSNFAITKNEDGEKRNNSSYLQRGFFAKTGLNLNDNNEVSLSLGKNYNMKDVPINIYTISPRYWKYTTWNNTMMNLISVFKINNAVKLRGNIYTVNDFNILNSYDDNSYSPQLKPYAFSSTYDDYTSGVSLIPDINFNKIFSAKIALLFKRDTHYEQPNYNQPFKKFVADNYNAGIEKNFNLLKTDFILALNYNYLNIVEANGSPLRSGIHVFNGHFGIGKNLNDKIYIYAHVSESSRFPTLKELFSDLLGSNIANPGLSEEHSLNSETGIKFNDTKIGIINLALYLSKVHNMILNVPLGKNKYQYQNAGDVTLSGVEFSYKKSIKYADININYTYLYSENNSDTSSDKLEYRPEHSANIVLNKNYIFGFGWRLETYYTGKRYGIDGDTKAWKSLADFTIFNIRLSQNIFNNYDLILRVNNLTDKYYEVEYGFPMQGRNINLGIEAHL